MSGMEGGMSWVYIDRKLESNPQYSLEWIKQPEGSQKTPPQGG